MNRHENARKKSLSLLALMALGPAIAIAGCGVSKGSTASSAKADPKISVATARPGKKDVQGALALAGTIHAENEVQVVAETQGKVVAVFAETGERVSKGEVLVQIDDELKQSSLDTAQAAYDKSKSDWDRAQGLFSQKVISDSDRQGAKLALANAESQLLLARRDLENAKVRAPLAGVVTQRFVTVGSMLGGGAPVVHIVDTDDLKMTVRVGERDVLNLHDGMAVDIDSDLYPDVVFTGRVSAISPQGDTALTFPVEIALKSVAGKPLYDGMSARARIKLGQKEILAIPRASLAGDYQKPQVYVVKDGTAKLTDIVTGGEYGTDIEVLRGLDESDQIVTGGQNNLSEGVSVIVSDGNNR
jgi:RND family efflux transporter MFP subunit